MGLFISSSSVLYQLIISSSSAFYQLFFSSSPSTPSSSSPSTPSPSSSSLSGRSWASDWLIFTRPPYFHSPTLHHASACDSHECVRPSRVTAPSIGGPKPGKKSSGTNFRDTIYWPPSVRHSFVLKAKILKF